jgi:hypothetical protein
VAIERTMWVTYCDDVRQELGNKLSYMGVYGPQLIVPDYPAAVLKLCVVMTVRGAAKAPPKSVIFRVLRNDEIVCEHAVDPGPLADAAGPDDRYFAIGAIAQLVNVEFAERTMLRARAIVDGEELRGGSLEMLAAEIHTESP